MSLIPVTVIGVYDGYLRIFSGCSAPNPVKVDGVASVQCKYETQDFGGPSESHEARQCFFQHNIDYSLKNYIARTGTLYLNTESSSRNVTVVRFNYGDNLSTTSATIIAGLYGSGTELYTGDPSLGVSVALSEDIINYVNRTRNQARLSFGVSLVDPVVNPDAPGYPSLAYFTSMNAPSNKPFITFGCVSRGTARHSR